MAFEPALLQGGYVTDLLLTVTFDADVWEEGHLGTPPFRYLRTKIHC